MQNHFADHFNYLDQQSSYVRSSDQQPVYPDLYFSDYAACNSQVKDLNIATGDFYMSSSKQNTGPTPANPQVLFYDEAQPQELINLSNFGHPAFASSEEFSQIAVTPVTLAKYPKSMDLKNQSSTAPAPSFGLTKVSKLSPTKQHRRRPTISSISTFSDKSSTFSSTISADFYLPPSTPGYGTSSPVSSSHPLTASPFTSPYCTESSSGQTSISTSPQNNHLQPRVQFVPPVLQLGPQFNFQQAENLNNKNNNNINNDNNHNAANLYASPKPDFSPTLDHFDQTPESASVPQFLVPAHTPNLGGDISTISSESLMPPPPSPTKPHRHASSQTQVLYIPLLDNVTQDQPSSLHPLFLPQENALDKFQSNKATRSIDLTTSFEPQMSTPAPPSRISDNLAWQPVIMGPSNKESEAIIKIQQQRAAAAAAGGLTAPVASTRKSCLPPGEVDSYLSGPSSTTGLFKCLYPSCGKLFKRRYNVRSHIQTHLSDRPYQCEGCQATFVRPHDLRRHEKCHEPEKPFKCICGKTFTRHDALQRHRLRLICEGGLEVAGKPPKPPGRRGRPRKPTIGEREYMDEDEYDGLTSPFESNPDNNSSTEYIPADRQFKTDVSGQAFEPVHDIQNYRFGSTHQQFDGETFGFLPTDQLIHPHEKLYGNYEFIVSVSKP